MMFSLSFNLQSIKEFVHFEYQNYCMWSIRNGERPYRNCDNYSKFECYCWQKKKNNNRYLSEITNKSICEQLF